MSPSPESFVPYMPQGPATAETVSETLTGALTLLGPGGDHWTQGALTRRNPDGTFSYCLVGAIERAAPNYDSYAAARDELKATLSADGNGTKLDRWNNSATWPDVQRVLTATAQRVSG